MNIFCLDNDPVVAARSMGDQHVRSKMIIESAQMLANCFRLDDLLRPDCPRTAKSTPRKYSYIHHPCSVWVMESRENMTWLINHTKALEEERLFRLPECRPHFSMQFVLWEEQNILLSRVPTKPQTPFAIAISEDKRCRQDPRFATADTVGKYRLYYELDKTDLTWTRREPKYYETIVRG